MEALGDVRIVAIPCVLAASLLQYAHFAKKPMAFPWHRITERCSKHCAMAGMAMELLSLRLLPLCVMYPMNAACLVFFYYWKESKLRKSGGSHFNEVRVCGAVLGAWLLPFLGPAGARAPRAMRLSELFDAVLGPSTCLYVAGLLAAGIAAHCWIRGRPGGDVLRSCAPAGFNFGVSALLLKALAELLASITGSPGRPLLWGALAAVLGLLLAVRNAAATPLRRAVEAHDHLSVLAAYGLLSSAAAVATGGLAYGELSSWGLERRLAYAAVASAHGWGMRSLCALGTDSKGYASVPKDAESASSPHAEAAGSQGGGKRSAVQGSSKTVEMVGVGASRSQPGGPPSPLFRFNEPPAGNRRTVDEDAQIEDDLFASALAPQRLAPLGPTMLGAAQAGVEDLGGIVPGIGLPEPQFDADFEEIMRRFDEDDKPHEVAITTESAVSPVDDLAKPVPGASPPSVLTGLDAQTLLDVSYGGQDDEDELLRSIQDIDLP